MKTTILKGVILCSALALASCSTPSQLASGKKADDDVYFSEAKAGDQPDYRMPISEDRYVNADEMANDDDEYYYYDSYSSRINRFGYTSPFGYYDDFYYGYSPYAYGAYGYGSPYYGGGWGLGVGLGYGYGSYYGGFSPFGYGYYGYSPYSYWGTGYGLGYGGGYPYWGVYSAYGRAANPRPYRGPGIAGTSYGSATRLSRPATGYNGAYPNTMNYPGRAVYSNGSGNYGRRTTPRNGSNGNYVPPSRPQREDMGRPTYQPRSTGSSFGGGGMSSGGGGSRGGGRPSRP
ncbi:hypothetical protein KHS38_01060 [Mucilaginibacter sp. Bleaf8]|uniref:hypothetical protein n=1 Tax=Mucilaginibacter sp. Bleaf8 TaxID=2834430 RepID=UPI001BD05F72|nr:hypothetical protein [Mucilaginibacter sp. Bleaf8]MBS7562978.1 hypothetical protein [Mucilaginibacter sp. Bleaf8]